jgi:hypothetical protein
VSFGRSWPQPSTGSRQSKASLPSFHEAEHGSVLRIHTPIRYLVMLRRIRTAGGRAEVRDPRERSPQVFRRSARRHRSLDRPNWPKRVVCTRRPPAWPRRVAIHYVFDGQSTCHHSGPFQLFRAVSLSLCAPVLLEARLYSAITLRFVPVAPFSRFFVWADHSLTSGRNPNRAEISPCRDSGGLLSSQP